MTYDDATVRSEVLDALRGRLEPLGRQNLLPLCPSARDARDISFALNDLRKQGLVQRTADKRWEYAPVEPRPLQRDDPNSTPPGDEGQPAEREAPAQLSGRGGNGAAPAQAGHDTRDILRDLLKHNVQQSREILETYIEALDNPILNNLLAGLSAAQEALDHHDRSQHP